jgi:hypothetical protein
MVNRVWQHHFGTGLVPTPDNFGQSGVAPEQRELLDYLTAEFVEQGWRLKPLHRLILLSAAYRQGSGWHAAAARVDPSNRLWWHYPLRRLDAEAVRDSMLAVAGELDMRMGGPCIPTRRADDGTVILDRQVDGSQRRSVYLQQRRTQVLTFLELFDAPKIITTCSLRHTSTVPLQSLAMLNSEFARDRGAALSRRITATAGNEVVPFVVHAFRVACGRPPSDSELEASTSFIEAQNAVYGTSPEARELAYTDFCQMLLAGNAFLYVD